jgi:RNase P/RNase MRP subunit p30
MSCSEDVTTAAASAKRLAALLREARAVQRRLDKVAAAAAGEDSVTWRNSLKPVMRSSGSSIA